MDRRIKQESHDGEKSAQTATVAESRTMSNKRSRIGPDQQNLLDDPNFQIDKLKKMLEAEQNLCKQLQDKLIKKDERIEYYLKLNENAAKSSISFSRILQDAEVRNKADLAKVETFEKLYKEQKEANELAVAQVKRLEIQNNDLKVKLSDAKRLFNEEIVQQKAHFERLQKDISQSVDKEIRTLKAQNTELQNELSRARKINEDAASQNSGLKKQNQEFSGFKELHDLALEQIRKLEAQHRSLRIELHKVRNEHGAVTSQQFLELEAQNCELVSKVKEIEGIRKAEKDADSLWIKNLITQNNALRQELTKLAIVQDSVKIAEQKVTELEAQNSGLIARMGALIRAKNSSTNEIAAANVKISELEAQNQNFKNTVQEISSRNQRKYTELQKEKDDLKLELQKEKDDFNLKLQKCAEFQQRYRSIAVAHVKKLRNLHRQKVATILKLKKCIKDQKRDQSNARTYEPTQPQSPNAS